ncbi:hemophore-related protein [Mycobacterium sp. IDR2000157661]|uniref:hemophore-related protein n=1 Tax=Mycobacterium sp. IDR2000157661 TaxID=2867005 RepID=UPI00351D1151
MVGAVTSVGTAGVATIAAAGIAVAQPTPPDPCSPAAVMRAHAATMTQMADFLDSRPDVQQVFVDARSKGTPQERHAVVQSFTDTHPDVAAAFQNIHQPMKDLMARCGLSMGSGMMPGGMGHGDTGAGGMVPGHMGPGGMPPGQMAPGGPTPGQ